MARRTPCQSCPLLPLRPFGCPRDHLALHRQHDDGRFLRIRDSHTAAILTGFLGLSTIAFGIIDVINQGASAVVRIAAGWVSDRTGQLNALRWPVTVSPRRPGIGFLFAGGFWAIAGIVTGDRIGKGIRTAPRDALISGAAQPDYLARSFGVRRMLDSIGAATGPLLAFLVLIPNGFSTVFIVSLAFSVLGVAALMLMVPVRGRGSVAPAREVRPGFRWAQLRWATLKKQGLARLLVTAGLLGILTIGDGFIYLILQDKGSFAVQWFPLLYVGTNVVFLLFAIPLGNWPTGGGAFRSFWADTWRCWPATSLPPCPSAAWAPHSGACSCWEYSTQPLTVSSPQSSASCHRQRTWQRPLVPRRPWLP